MDLSHIHHPPPFCPLSLWEWVRVCAASGTRLSGPPTALTSLPLSQRERGVAGYFRFLQA